MCIHGCRFCGERTRARAAASPAPHEPRWQRECVCGRRGRGGGGGGGGAGAGPGLGSPFLFFCATGGMRSAVRCSFACKTCTVHASDHKQNMRRRGAACAPHTQKYRKTNPNETPSIKNAHNKNAARARRASPAVPIHAYTSTAPAAGTQTWHLSGTRTRARNRRATFGSYSVHIKIRHVIQV